MRTSSDRPFLMEISVIWLAATDVVGVLGYVTTDRDSGGPMAGERSW